MLMRFWTDSYAPGCVQVQPVNDRHTRRFLKDMERNGAPQSKDRSTLLSFEDAHEHMSAAQFSDLEMNWSVRVRMDDWTARQLYGYSRL